MDADSITEEDSPLLVDEILLTGKLPSTLPQLPPYIREPVLKHFRDLKPPCPSCHSSEHVYFRYFNNKDKSRTLQARYVCKNPTCSFDDVATSNASAISSGNAKKKAYYFTYNGYQCKQKVLSSSRKSKNIISKPIKMKRKSRSMINNPETKKRDDVVSTSDIELSRHWKEQCNDEESCDPQAAMRFDLDVGKCYDQHIHPGKLEATYMQEEMRSLHDKIGNLHQYYYPDVQRYRHHLPLPREDEYDNVQQEVGYPHTDEPHNLKEKCVSNDEEPSPELPVRSFDQDAGRYYKFVRYPFLHREETGTDLKQETRCVQPDESHYSKEQSIAQELCPRLCFEENIGRRHYLSHVHPFQHTIEDGSCDVQQGINYLHIDEPLNLKEQCMNIRHEESSEGIPKCFERDIFGQSCNQPVRHPFQHREEKAHLQQEIFNCSHTNKPHHSNERCITIDHAELSPELAMSFEQNSFSRSYYQLVQYPFQNWPERTDTQQEMNCLRMDEACHTKMQRIITEELSQELGASFHPYLHGKEGTYMKQEIEPGHDEIGHLLHNPDVDRYYSRSLQPLPTHSKDGSGDHNIQQDLGCTNDQPWHLLPNRDVSQFCSPSLHPLLHKERSCDDILQEEIGHVHDEPWTLLPCLGDEDRSHKDYQQETRHTNVAHDEPLENLLLYPVHDDDKGGHKDTGSPSQKSSNVTSEGNHGVDNVVTKEDIHPGNEGDPLLWTNIPDLDLASITSLFQDH